MSEGTQASLVRLTEDLIRFRSTESRPDVLNACADYLAHLFDGTDLTVERFSFCEIPSLVVTKGTKTPEVFLSGHFDVVEGDDAQFNPVREGDRLVGRGALDMKSGIAVMATMMRELAASPHSVGLMLTGDEESGGFHGTKHLLERGYGCQVAVIPDGGEAVHRVVTKEKGILQIVLRASGYTAHGSQPWKGQNAIELLCDAIHRMQSLFLSTVEHPEDHWVSTMNVGHIVGGESINQVPGFAYALCDIRFTEQESEQELLQRLQTVMPEGAVVEARASGSPINVSLGDPLVAPYLEAIRVHGRDPVIGCDHGSSDGRFFAARGIPIILSQPDGGGLHGPNEWVHLPSLELYYQVLRTYLDSVAKT